jgi:hypothetical protein
MSLVALTSKHAIVIADKKLGGAQTVGASGLLHLQESKLCTRRELAV